MKEKLQKEVVRFGSKNVDHQDLTAIEAVSMSAVAILALTVGTLYADKLF